MNEINKINVFDFLSPEMQKIIQYYENNAQSEVNNEDYDAQRIAYNADRRYWNANAPALFSVKDIVARTAKGDVVTRIYQPAENTPATVFYLHGGGFILGNLDTHDRIMRLLALDTGCTVIGIDYTLSPEARYPQAIEEAVAVCQFYYQYADKFALSMQHIGFAGDSVGAMLSLATVLWLRDKQIYCGNICAVLLWYGLYGLQVPGNATCLFTLFAYYANLG